MLYDECVLLTVVELKAIITACG